MQQRYYVTHNNQRLNLLPVTLRQAEELVRLSGSGRIEEALDTDSMVDIRCHKCGIPHFEGDCLLDPTYGERHFTGISR